MSLVVIMTLKKLQENRFFSIQCNSKVRSRIVIPKHGTDNVFINLLSEFGLNLTQGNVQLSEGILQQTKQHLSLVSALDCKKGKAFNKTTCLSGRKFLFIVTPNDYRICKRLINFLVILVILINLLTINQMPTMKN